MMYDVFTHNEYLAERIISCVDRAYCVDDSEQPELYQFFDMLESQMRSLRGLLLGSAGEIEIRDSSSGGFVWPSEKGVSLEQALDFV